MEAIASSPQINEMGPDLAVVVVLNSVESQDLGGVEEEDDATAEPNDLPIGIFPEAHPESCYHALRSHDLACTRLNAELFYEMNQLGRNRLIGCSTRELGEIDLWDQVSGASIWDEPMGRLEGRLLTPEEQLDNANRDVRWRHVERFLKEVYGWCRDGLAPEIVPHHNRQGRATWRFRRLRWTEDGIFPDDSAVQEETAGCKEILQAAWNFLFWCRRRWLKGHPGKVWLSEHRLHLIRCAFRALLNHFEVPESERPEIREEPKPVWPSKLEGKLAQLEDRETRALQRLNYLWRRRLLDKVKLRQALAFFDDLSEEMALTQRRMDEEIIRLARKNGYDQDYRGTRLDLADLTPDELLELKEEMWQSMAAEPDLPPDNSSGFMPIDVHPGPHI